MHETNTNFYYAIEFDLPELFHEPLIDYDYEFYEPIFNYVVSEFHYKMECNFLV